MKYLYSIDAPVDANALTVTVGEVWGQLETQGYAHFDLTNLPNCNCVHLAVMLRALWFCRDVIKGHTEALLKCKQLCIEQNVDYNDALAGMLNE